MIKILTVIFILLQVFDGWTTYQCLTQGKGKEGNKVVAWLIAKLGIAETLAVMKTLISAVVAYVSVFFPSQLWMIALAVLGLGYSWVAWNNWKRLKINDKN